MRCLDVVRVVVPPRSSHSFRISVIGDDVVVIGKFLVTDGANASLLPDLAVQQFPHFCRRSEFPISTRMMQILNPLHAKSDRLWLGKRFSPTAGKRSVDGTQFIIAKSHGVPLKTEFENQEGGSEEKEVRFSLLQFLPRENQCRTW